MKSSSFCIFLLNTDVTVIEVEQFNFIIVKIRLTATVFPWLVINLSDHKLYAFI